MHETISTLPHFQALIAHNQTVPTHPSQGDRKIATNTQKCLTKEASGHRGGTAMPTQRPNQNQASHTESRTIVEGPTTQALALGSTPEILLRIRQRKAQLAIHLLPPPHRRHPNVQSVTRLSNARSVARMLRRANTSSITGWSSRNWKLAHQQTCKCFLFLEKLIGGRP